MVPVNKQCVLSKKRKLLIFIVSLKRLYIADGKVKTNIS